MSSISCPTPPPEDIGATIHDPDRESYIYSRYRVSEYLQGFEHTTGAPIVDETGFSRLYRLELPLRKNFEDIREFLTREYGITLTRERREILISHLEPVPTAR